MNKTVQVAGFALKEADAEWFMEYLRETIEYHENRIKTFTFEGVATKVHKEAVDARKRLIHEIMKGKIDDGVRYIDSFEYPLNYAVDVGEWLYALEMVLRSKKQEDSRVDALKTMRQNLGGGWE